MIKRLWWVPAAALLVSGCGGGAVALVTAAPDQVFTTLVISPTSATLSVGGTYPLALSPRDQTGGIMSVGMTTLYSSSDSAVATVSSAGVVTAVAPGTTTISASSTIDGVTRTATCALTVTAGPPPGGTIISTAGFRFAPSSVTIAVNDSVEWEFVEAVHNVAFTGVLPAGGNITDQQPGAKVYRTFNTPGTYTFECTRHGTMRGQVVVTSQQPAVFTTLTLSPATPAIAVGATVQLTASPLDQNGNAMSGLGQPGFVSSDTSMATVTPTGVVTGVGAGSATITATLTGGGLTHFATAVVTVTNTVPAGLTITTPNLNFAPPTLTIDPGQTVTWQFSGATHNVTFLAAAPTGGSIPDQQPGNAVTRTFSTSGTYQYECTRHNGMAGTIVVRSTGGSVFSSLALTPASPSIAVGGTVQLTATALDQNGNAMTGLPAPAFQSSAPTVSSVGSSGLVTGFSAGTASIIAYLTVNGVTHGDTSIVTVTAAQPGSVTITTPNQTFAPPTVTIATGGTVTWQFSGSTHNVTFQGGAPTGGNIPDQQPGNAVSRTFTSSGTYQYQCTRHGGMSGTIVVQGGQGSGTYTSLAIAPAAPTVAVGSTVQLTATPLDQNGLPLAGLPAASFTSNAAIATVSPSGIVTGVAPGAATITASLTSNGVTHTAATTVTVTQGGTGGVVITTPGSFFAPEDTTVSPGTTVTWQFSGTTHNVTFTSIAPIGGSIPDTAPGASVSRTFTARGDYDYECTLHHNMKGRIRVQ